MLEKVLNSVFKQLDGNAHTENKTAMPPFTAAYNVLHKKALFYDRVEKAVINAQCEEKALAVLCLNLDGSNITDASGDVLMYAEQRISKALRKGDTVVRTGRDECLILAQNLNDMNAVEAVANKVMAAFSTFAGSGMESRVSAGIGCAVYPIDGNSAEALIGNADIAAFRAKKSGREKVVFYSNPTGKDILKEMKVTNGIYYAIERDELELYYQPQVDSKTEKIVGLEALLRWNRPEGGMTGPENFISVAEKTGLIMQIGEWVARTACRQNKQWQDKGLPRITVAVNLSALQFNDEHMAESIHEVLKETGLSAGYFGVEITENIAIKDLSGVVATLKELKQLGVGIAVDDFGTAYSSLNYIKHLPVDIIKIDKCFIDGIGASPKDEAVLKTVIALIHNLGTKAVAEGVETKAQVDFLTREGCNIIQGFYYYKPMPANDIEKLLRPG